ncbi:FO synthase subunit 1, partial [Durusdinium trenchii]
MPRSAKKKDQAPWHLPIACWEVLLFGEARVSRHRQRRSNATVADDSGVPVERGACTVYLMFLAQAQAQCNVLRTSRSVQEELQPDKILRGRDAFLLQYESIREGACLSDEMEYYGNHLILIGDDNVKPEDPPHCCFLLPELPENLGAAVLRICPEKYIALRDGMNKVSFEASTFRLEREVLPVGGPDVFLSRRKLEFAKWLDHSFPPSSHRNYADSFRPGPVTDSDLLGVERLAVFMPTDEWLDGTQGGLECLPPLEPGSQLLRPFSIGYVKGWRRSVAALIVMQGFKELDIDLDTLPRPIRASFGTIHGTAGEFQDAKQAVLTSRGITMSSTSVRKSPHCFNMLRQIQVLKNAKAMESAEVDWNSASNVAKAFAIGVKEATAVSCLTKVNPEVCELLRAAIRGMRPFLQHDVIAKECFNVGWSSGKISEFEAWRIQLTNTDELVALFVDRLIKDWDRQPVGLKKSWGYREAAQLHAVCGAFIHYTNVLKAKISEETYQAELPGLKEQFAGSFLDPELLHSLQSSVPPGDISSISVLRDIVKASEQRLSREAEQCNEELEKKLHEATLQHLKAKVEQDLELLRKRMPTKEAEAIESALDVKYVRDRQMQGSSWVQEWLQDKCKLNVSDEKGLEMVLAIVGLDTTLWPSNVKLLNDAVKITSNVLHMSAGNCAHIQLPLCHAATTHATTLKHIRNLQDLLLNAQLDISSEVALIFTKDDAARSDRRKTMQQRYCATTKQFRSESAWNNSKAVQVSHIPGLQLIKVTDMLGYDDVTKPTPGARVEQTLSQASRKGVACHTGILASYLDGMDLGPNDKLIFLDVIPNGCCEFAKACVEHNLAGKAPEIFYFGCLNKDQKDVVTSITERLYQFWDASKSAPPKTRQRQAQPQEQVALSVLAWDRGVPKWPSSLSDKFAVGTPQYLVLQDLKQQFEQLYPQSTTQPTAPENSAVPPRASGQCDFSIDEGRQPMDVHRVVDLAPVATDEIGERLAYVAGKGGRPSIIVTSAFEILLGNEDNAKITLDASELFGSLGS